MILREYQKNVIEETKLALNENSNTLVVAPTGAGKTIILSSLIEDLTANRGEDLFASGKTVVLQHRLNLVKQNSEKFLRVAPDFFMRTSILTGQEKDASGDVIFATIQTLSNNGSFDLVPKLDYLIVDEAHHAAADTYRTVIDHYWGVNPDMKVVGLTATADRSDGKGLGDVFDNIAYKIDTDFLIEMGYLVPPNSFVVSIGINEELDTLRDERLSEKARNEKLSGIYEPMRYRIAEEWEKMASDRHTICFCTTIDEAVAMSDLFNERGHNAHFVHSKLPAAVNQSIIDDFHRGKFQVLFNAAILTEGFDCPTVDCVMLMRSCSAKSTMIQMVGRGLRPIVDEKDKWSKKVDCLILDFGDSIKTHGTLRSDINLKKIREVRGEGDDAVYVLCPACQKIVIVHEHDEYCPKCGAHILESIEAAAEKEMKGDAETGKVRIKNFEMVAIDLTNNSPFAWVEISDLLSGGQMTIWVAGGFDHMVAIGQLNEDLWAAVGIPSKDKGQILGVGKRSVAFAHCNNYMSNNETSSSSKKFAHWHHKPPSNSQYNLLTEMQWDPTRGDREPSNSYEASCMISFIKGYKKFALTIGQAKQERNGVNESQRVG